MNNAMEEYYWYKEHHICVKCHQQDARPNCVTCYDCADKEAIYREQTYRLPTKKSREYKRNLYKVRKEAGICTRCGKKKASKGLTTCIDCRTKTNRNANDRRKLLNAQKRKYLGICLRCNNPVVDGYCYCEEHLKRQQQICAEMTERRAEQKDGK